MKRLFFIVLVLLAGSAFGQHTGVTLEDAQTITGYKTINGVYNAAVCATGARSNAWCSGSDLSAWINAAAGACLGTCEIYVPSGTYNITGTVAIGKPGISLRGAGSGATVLNYVGSGDAIRVQMNPFVITQAGKIEGLTINCNSCAAGANGLHVGDVIGLRLIDLHVENFSGTGSACLWSDNVSGWTERGSEQAVHLDNCTTLHRWTNTANTQSSSSFGHWPLVEERWNLTGSQTGWSIEGGSVYDGGLFSFTGNAQGPNTLLSVSGTQYSGGGGTTASASQWSEQIEQTTGGPSNVFSIRKSSLVSGCGFFNLSGFSLGTTNHGLSISDTACPIFNGQSFAVRNSSGTSDPVIGMNSSNQTVIQGDGTGQAILLQPNPGTSTVSVVPGGVNIVQSGTAVLTIGTAAPTISSGFNAGSVSASNGTASFVVAVGTGSASSTGVIGLPTTRSGWNCYATNQSRADLVLETNSSTNSATLTNYSTTFTATNWTSGDNILVSCFGR